MFEKKFLCLKYVPTDDQHAWILYIKTRREYICKYTNKIIIN